MADENEDKPFVLEEHINEIEGTTPGVPPPMDEAWLAEMRAAGLAPSPTPPAPAKILRPKATRSDKGAKHVFGAKQRQLDDGLSKEDYLAVYDAFAQTGIPSGIAHLTGHSLAEVEHLLERGIVRLQLPPIRTHAVDLAEVNKRLAENKLTKSNANVDNYRLNDPDIQDAITNRVAREAAAAQTHLSAAMDMTRVFMQVLDEVKKALVDPERGVKIGALKPGDIQQLAIAGEKLSSAVDRAVRLSRLTAGEPESNIAIHVAALVAQLPADVVAEFGATGRIPRQLRGRLGSDEGGGPGIALPEDDGKGAIIDMPDEQDGGDDGGSDG